MNVKLIESFHFGILSLWQNKAHTDVTFIVNGEKITAHRLILASQSEYFKQLLFGVMKESKQDVIELKDVEDAGILKLLMEYAYTGCLKLENNIEVYVCSLKS